MMRGVMVRGAGLLTLGVASVSWGQERPASASGQSRAEEGGAQAGSKDGLAASIEAVIAELPLARAEHAWSGSRWREHWTMEVMSGRLERGMLTSEQLGRAVLKSVPLRGSAKWFRNRPYAVWLRAPAWLCDYEIVARPVLKPAEKARAHLSCGLQCGNALEWQEEEESFQVIGLLPEGTAEVMFDVTVRPARDGAKWQGRVPLPVELIDEVEREPDATNELTAAVREANVIRIRNELYNGHPSLWMNSRFVRPISGVLQNTSVAIVAELLRDGEVIAAQRFEDPDDTGSVLASTRFIRGEVAERIAARKEIERFTIRVRGEPPKDDNRWCRTRYWAGAHTIPLGQVLDEESGVRAKDR